MSQGKPIKIFFPKFHPRKETPKPTQKYVEGKEEDMFRENAVFNRFRNHYIPPLETIKDSGGTYHVVH